MFRVKKSRVNVSNCHIVKGENDHHHAKEGAHRKKQLDSAEGIHRFPRELGDWFVLFFHHDRNKYRIYYLFVAKKKRSLFIIIIIFYFFYF